MNDALNKPDLNKSPPFPKALQHKVSQSQRSALDVQSIKFFSRILSTSWKNYELDRNAGFLRSNTRLQLLLTVLSRHPFKEKLQVMYGKVLDPDATFQDAWKKLKKSSSQVHKQVIPITLKDQEEESEDLEDNEAIRPKSQDSKSRGLKPKRESINIKPLSSNMLQTIQQQHELKYLLQKGRNTTSMKKAMEHIEREKRKYLDNEERDELIYQKQETERKYRMELNRSEKLTQQLQIAEKKLQNNSVEALKFQVGHTLGVVCQEYHTSFAGLALLALTFFMLGYLIAKL